MTDRLPEEGWYEFLFEDVILAYVSLRFNNEKPYWCGGIRQVSTEDFDVISWDDDRQTALIPDGVKPSPSGLGYKPLAIFPGI